MINNLLKASIAILLQLAVMQSFSATTPTEPTDAVVVSEKKHTDAGNTAAPPPTFSNCPSNISGITPSNGNCTASVLWVPPNVSGGVGTVTVTSNYNPGESFFPGTHRVIYRATDSNGDTAFCSFNVTVSDFQPPIINVPSDITVSADPGSCGAVVTFPYPSSTDNCPAGTGESPLEENFDGGEDFSQLCYVFEGAAVGNGGNIDGTNEFETEDLVNFDTRSLMMPLTRFNGAGEIFFDHMIDRGTGNLTMHNSRITVSLVSTGGLITPIFNEQYTNENVQTEYIPITVSGDFYVLFEFDTDDNRGDVAFLDNIYLPGFVVADEADSGQCTAAVRRVVQISGQPFRSGVEFPVGTTTLEYFTRDAVGNINFNSFNVTVTNNINPPVGNSVNFCEGTAIPELSVSTDPTEVADWYDAPSGGNLLIADSNTYTPSGPGTFYVETRNPITGCTSATRTSISLIEDPQPNPPLVTTPVEYCIGDTAAQLTATADAGNSLEWFTVPTGGTALASAPTPDTSTAGTTNYYVQQINGSTGCISDRALIEVIVYVIPAAPSVTSPVQFCIGDTAQALDTYATGTNLTWYDAATGGNVIPGGTVPSTASVGTTSFWVTQTTTSANCESLRTRLNIEVNNAPTITTQPTNETVCENDTAAFTVVASSPGAYQWQLFSGGTWSDLSDTAPYSNTTTSTLTITGVTLALNGNRYRAIVSGLSPSCADATSQERTLTVNPLPTVVANATNTAICVGDAVTLTGSGATSYTWDNGVTDGVSFTPASTTTYTVTGTDGNGCQNTDTITITVNPLPTVTANTTSTTICAGDAVTLTGSGATSYTWDNGVTDGVAFTPASTTTYTVTGTDGNGCQNTDTITITVNPLPTVTANATTILICEGDPVTLTGSGATSYAWDNGITDGVSFNPTATTTYTVTGTDGNGCEDTDTITVTVNPAPTITIDGAPSCSSDLTVYSLSVNVSTGTVTSTEGNVTDNGGNNWTIDNITSGNDITLTVTAGNGCVNTLPITAPDCSCPTVNAPTSGGDQTQCEANPIQTLTATATPPAGATIVWYDAATGGNVVASPTLNTVGTITYFAESVDTVTSCTSSSRTPVALTIQATPAAPTSGGDQTQCEANPIQTLTATATPPAGATIVWYDAASGGNVVASPTLNTVGTVTYFAESSDNTSSCTSFARTPVVLTIQATPTIAVDTAPTCAADLLTYSLSVNVSTGTVTSTEGNVTDNGGNNWTIDNITSGNDITLTVTAGNGCVNTLPITAPDCSCPTVNAPTSGGDQTQCEANPIQTLTATATPPAGATIVWYDAATGGNVVASPTLNTVGTITYFAESVDTVTSCTSSSRTPVALTIQATPAAPTSGGDQTQCEANPIQTLTATATPPAGATVVWYDAASGGNVVASPTLNTVGTVTYFAESSDNTSSCTSFARTPVVLTIQATPTIAVDTAPTCAADLLTYSLSVNVSTGTVTSTEGNVTDNGGNNWTIDNITSGNDITLTVTAGNGCVNTLPITAPDCSCPTVNAPTSGGDQTQCEANPIQTLTATATPPAGATIVWYDAATGGNVVASPTLNTVGTITYFAESVDTVTSCTSSSRTPVALTIQATPAAPTSGGDQTQCEANPIQTLTATATPPAGATIVWYDAASGGNVVASPTLNTVGTVTYFAESSDNTSSCTSFARTPVVLTIQATPTITVDTAPTCAADLLTYSLSVNVSTGTVTSTEGNVTDNGGNNWTIDNITSGNDITLTVTAGNGCVNTLPITAPDCSCPTVNAPTSGGDQTQCEANPIQTLTATATPPAGATIVWYDAATGGNVVASPTLNTVGTITYFAESVDTVTSCTSSSRTPVALTIQATPAAPTSGGDQTQCEANPIQTLTATATPPAGATIVWYDAASGGNVVASPTLNTVGTVTYFAESSDNTSSCTSFNRTPVVLTIQATPTITVDTAPTCAADLLTYSLSVNVSTGTVTSTEGNVTDNGGNNWTIDNITSGNDITLTVTAGNGCVNTLPITAPDCSCPTVNAPTSGGDQTQCEANPIQTLTATATPPAGATIVWYDAATGGNVVASPTLNTVGTITYFAESVDTVTSCTSSSRTPVALTIQATPAAPTSGGDQTQCEANPIQTLTATATPPAGATIVWYDAASGGNVVASPTLNTVGTVTYFAESSDNTSSCTSFARTPVVLTINALPTVVANATSTTINAGEPVTLTGSGATTYVWDNGVTDGDTVNPLVTTTYTVIGTDGNGCQNTDSVTITVMPTSDLRLDKIVDNAVPNVGDNVTFTLTVVNDGPTDDAGGSTINDILPIGYTYISDNGGAGNGTYSNTTGNWILPAIANGASVSIDITATVNSPTGAAAEYTNIAEVITATNFDSDSTPNNDDGDQSEDDEASASVTPQVTDLEVINTISSSDANPGDVLTISVEVINNGSNDASNITIDNIVPQGFTVTTINNGGVQTGNTIVWSGMNIANGTSTILTFEVTVNIPTNTADEYLNTVQVMQVDQFDPDSTPNNDDGDQSEDDEDNTFIILIPADLNLTKGLSAASNQNPNAGDTVTFEVTVTNDGPGLATNVSVEDQIPSGLTIGAINDGGVLTGNTITWTIPSLAVGSQVVSYEVTINAPANVLDEYRNIAQVTASDQFDPDSTPNNDDGDQSEDDEASFTIPSPTVDIEVVKTVDKAQTFFGDTVVFTIAATNNSTYDATNIGIEDALPTGYSLESVVASHGAYNETISTWEIPLITAGETATLEMTVTVTNIDNYTNIAQLIYVDQIDPNVDNDRDEATPEVTQEECLTVFNEFSPNNDGLNDVFFIECIDRYPNNLLQIFNRWGTKVFEMKGYDNTWDGISQGRATVGASEKLPVGTYYYVLDLADGVNKPKTGWLYISR